MKKSFCLLVLNGPNLNLLGTREPEIYGRESLDNIETALRERAQELGSELDLEIELDLRQSNSESELTTWIGESRGKFDGLIFNPAAFTHTSLALSDALKAIADDFPAIEVHLSNTAAREDIRHTSLTAPACIGQIQGFRGFGYILALDALIQHLTNNLD